MKRVLPIVFLFVALTCASRSQFAHADPVIDEQAASSLFEAAGQQTMGAAESIRERAALKPANRCETLANDDVRERCDAANIAYYKYFEFGLKHRQKVFQWQNTSSKIIFIVVIFLVGMGMIFAWRQFERGFNRPPDAEAPGHTLEIGTAGVKVSSPVLGVIILTLSLAFFYLYLVYVYPIIDTI